MTEAPEAQAPLHDIAVVARPTLPDLSAMMAAADIEWRANAAEDWGTIDFWRWPRGFHRSAWVIAGYIGWNPLDVLDKPTPAARAVNALLTRQCVIFAIVMTRHTPDPGDPDEPLLAWFNASVDEHKHDIADMIEGVGDVDWGLPTSRRWAARRLVKMWETGGVSAVRDLSAALKNKPRSV
jgi:hypothetical protein